MAELLLEIEPLLAPIPGDDPAGEAVPFALRSELDEDRKELNPDDFDENDPLRPTEVKRADWKGILRKASDLLATRSKDMLLAARVAEALTKLHGFRGFTEGFGLLRRMLDECWDRLHPGIEDGDLEVRAGQFNWLGDEGRGGRFPHTIRTLPLFPAEDGAISFFDWKRAQENKGRFTREQVDKAVTEASRQHCHDLVLEIDAAVEELKTTLGVLNARLGSAAPGMGDLRTVVMEVSALMKQALQRKGGPITAEEAAPPEEGGAEGGGEGGAVVGTGSAKKMVTRQDVYERLGEAADTLARIEPHSPVPYLVRRAIALGQLPFPLMMRELMRAEYAAALDEMNRELGIKDQPPA
ncbi:MAG: type VI secretion system protein TssA [Gemmataceae bacterium]|nr:type VI secretion system protein TssA [Gemmataceae bacterium]